MLESILQQYLWKLKNARKGFSIDSQIALSEAENLPCSGKDLCYVTRDEHVDYKIKLILSAYWLVKEKVWNPTLSSLADLPTLPSLHVMKNLQFSAQSSTGEIFFVTEQCKLLWSPNCWGYKCIFPRNKTENIETHALWTENVLKLHIAANVTNTPNNSKKQAQPKGERL